MIPRAAPADLPRLSDGSPLVIVSEGVVDPSPIASPALAVWIASARAGGLLLHPLGTRAPDPAETSPLPHPPAGTLALVAPEAPALAPLARWWEAAAVVPPPYPVLAATGAAALGGLLAAAAEALSVALLREAASARSVPQAGGAVPPFAPTSPEGGDSVSDDGGLLWDSARAIEGRVDLVALGREAPRPVLRARAGGRAILLVPGVTAHGMPWLRVLLAHGSGRGAAVCAWLCPEGKAPEEVTDLALPGPAWTGWQALKEGAALGLPFPAGFGARGYLAVGLRAGEEGAVVEVEGAALAAGTEAPRETSRPPPVNAVAPPAPAVAGGKPLGDPAAPRPGAPAEPPPKPPAPVPPEEMAPARPSSGNRSSGNQSSGNPATGAPYDGVRVKDHEPGETPPRLGLEILGLAAGTERWAVVRLNVAAGHGEPWLEFRLAADWPPVFEEWLGRQSDRSGPFLRILPGDIADFLDLVSDPRDAALVNALLAVLPGAVEEGCRQAGISPGEEAGWVEAARALQAAARPG